MIGNKLPKGCGVKIWSRETMTDVPCPYPAMALVKHVLHSPLQPNIDRGRFDVTRGDIAVCDKHGESLLDKGYTVLLYEDL